MSFQVRGVVESDAHSLLDIDIKCFDCPWTPTKWSDICRTHAIAVATCYDVPIGFGVCLRIGTEVELKKVAVKRTFRRHGLGRRLLSACIEFAVLHDCTRLFTIVPESHVYPGPECIGSWLVKTGFRAQKPFIKNHFRLYGEPEAGVTFSRPTAHEDSRNCI